MDISDITTTTEESVVPEVSTTPGAPAIPDAAENTIPRVDSSPPGAATDNEAATDDNAVTDDNAATDNNAATNENAVTDDNAVTNNEHHHPSPPTPAVETESQPSPVFASENENQAVLSSGLLTIPQQSPSDSTPPTTPSAPATGDVATSTGHPDDPTTISASPKVKVFTFDGSSNFITPSVIDYLETIPGGQGWINMVKAYLRLEQLPLKQGVRFLFSFPNHMLILR